MLSLIKKIALGIVAILSGVAAIMLSMGRKQDLQLREDIGEAKGEDKVIKEEIDSDKARVEEVLAEIDELKKKEIKVEDKSPEEVVEYWNKEFEDDK